MTPDRWSAEDAPMTGQAPESAANVSETSLPSPFLKPLSLRFFGVNAEMESEWRQACLQDSVIETRIGLGVAMAFVVVFCGLDWILKPDSFTRFALYRMLILAPPIAVALGLSFWHRFDEVQHHILSVLACFLCLGLLHLNLRAYGDITGIHVAGSILCLFLVQTGFHLRFTWISGIGAVVVIGHVLTVFLSGMEPAMAIASTAFILLACGLGMWTAHVQEKGRRQDYFLKESYRKKSGNASKMGLAFEQQVRQRTHTLEMVNEKLKTKIREHQEVEETRFALDEQLRHAQKMEAVGALASGIAHDFNNLLAVIMGFVEMIQAEEKEGSKERRYAREVMEAGERARELVSDMLSFSRIGLTPLEVFPLAPLVHEHIEQFDQIREKDIEIVESYKDEGGAILADQAQVGLAIDHMLRNAVQAVGNQGKIDVTIRLAEVGKGKELVADLLPGHYIVFEVKDSGIGISEQALPRVFEPFYTTREVGQGIGMGLAVVFAVARGFGGGVYARNLPESGASFALYLPATTADKIKETGGEGDGKQAVVGTGAVH